jgi:ferredoxin
MTLFPTVLAAADSALWLSPEGIGVIAGNVVMLLTLLWRTAGRVKSVEDAQAAQKTAFEAALVAQKTGFEAALAALEARRQLSCSTCRSQVDSEIAAVRNNTNLAVQELRQVRSALSELKQMMAQLQSDVSAIAINARVKLVRQPTKPFPSDEGG